MCPWAQLSHLDMAPIGLEAFVQAPSPLLLVVLFGTVVKWVRFLDGVHQVEVLLARDSNTIQNKMSLNYNTTGIKKYWRSALC
eukprot:867817-Amphidinium_carterae.1